jgi:hypothetical protein
MAKPKRSLKPIPEFANEAEERRFWETHDSAAYVDWSSAGFVRFPNLKPTTRARRKTLSQKPSRAARG